MPRVHTGQPPNRRLFWVECQHQLDERPTPLSELESLAQNVEVISLGSDVYGAALRGARTLHAAAHAAQLRFVTAVRDLVRAGHGVIAETGSWNWGWDMLRVPGPALRNLQEIERIVKSVGTSEQRPFERVTLAQSVRDELMARPARLWITNLTADKELLLAHNPDVAGLSVQDAVERADAELVRRGPDRGSEVALGLLPVTVEQALLQSPMRLLRYGGVSVRLRARVCEYRVTLGVGAPRKLGEVEPGVGIYAYGGREFVAIPQGGVTWLCGVRVLVECRKEGVQAVLARGLANRPDALSISRDAGDPEEMIQWMLETGLGLAPRSTP